ncbi:MAG: hypothetical protein VX187_06500 [Pseudomonadota bacterium]|nr:hypothetical protein [Pseudomonadota bacterium]MEC8046884.1 hypothetical protein [Pseudomonadota bacterium]
MASGADQCRHGDPKCAAAAPVFGQLMAKSGAVQHEDRDGPSH